MSVPTFTSKLAANTASAPFLRGRPSPALKQAGDRLMAEGMRIKDEEQRRANAAWVSQTAATLRSQEMEYFNGLRNSYEGDISQFSTAYMSELDERLGAQYENAPTAEAQEMLSAQMNSFGVQMHGQALAFQTQQQVATRFTQLTQSLDIMANNAMSNPMLYEQEMEAAHQMLEESAGDLPQDRQKQLRVMMDNRITRGYLRGVIETDPRLALQMLEDGDYDELLTRESREGLQNMAQSERARLEREAEAARREEYLMLKDTVEASTEVLTAGFQPGTIDGLDERLTALGGAEEASLRAMLSQAAVHGQALTEFNLLDLVGQRNVINQMVQEMRNPNTAETGAQIDLLRAYEQAYAQNQRDIETDALSHAVRTGFINTFQPLDWTNAETIGARGELAHRLSARYGANAMPFTDAEIDSFTSVWAEADPLSRQSLVNTLSSEWTPDVQRKFAERVAPENPTLGYVFGTISERPALANMILRGQSRLDAIPELRAGAAQYMPTIGNTFATLFPTSPMKQRMSTDAVLAVYAELSGGRYSENTQSGAMQVDQDLLEDAQRIVMGGVMRGGQVVGGDLTSQGQPVFAPLPGMTQENFDAGLSRMTDDHLLDYSLEFDPLTRTWVQSQSAAYTDDGTVITAEMIREAGRFQAVGDGKYIVVYSDGFLMTNAGAPFVIDLRGFFNLTPSGRPIDTPIHYGRGTTGDRAQ